MNKLNYKAVTLFPPAAYKRAIYLLSFWRWKIITLRLGVEIKRKFSSLIQIVYLLDDFYERLLRKHTANNQVKKERSETKGMEG